MTSTAIHSVASLSRAISTLERCVEKGLTRSAQVAVSGGGQTVAAAVGRTSLGTMATTDTAYAWSCATKPIAAIVVGTLVDEGAVSFGDPVGRFLPELGGSVGAITLAELLTHTAGLAEAGYRAYFPLGRRPEAGDTDAALREIAHAVRDPHVGPRKRAAYSVFSNWFLLSEVIERVVGAPCPDVVADRVFGRLGVRSRLWLSADDVAALDRAPLKLAWEHVTSAIPPDRPVPLDDFEVLDGGSPLLYSPGSSGVGPIHELVAVLDTLCADAVGGTGVLLSQSTARTIVAPHRVGILDTVAQNSLSWGLGLTADRRAFSPRLSAHTFGHVGISAIVFADPDRALAAGVAFDRQLEGPDGLVRHGAVLGALAQDMDGLR